MKAIGEVVERLAKNPAVVWINVDVADIIRSTVNLLWKIAALAVIAWSVMYVTDNITIVEQPQQAPAKQLRK